MKRLGFLLVLLGALIAASTSMAQDVTPDTQSGNFLFKMPNGWKPVQKDDTMIVYAPSPPPGTVTYFALAADDMDGDLQNSFRDLWGGFTKSYRVLEGGQTQSLHSTKGYDALYTTAVATDQNGTRWLVYVLGAQYKKRLQTVMFMSNVPPGNMLNAYLNVFQKTFLASLSFGDALSRSPNPLPGASLPVPGSLPPEEPPHKVPPGMLEGIYMGFGLDYNGHVGMKRLNFNPDGWVVKDVPQEGMIGFDFTAYRNAPSTNRSWVGRYRVDGNQINILWQDYADNRQIIKRNEAAFSPGVDTYVPMCRCTGKKFSGKYNFGLASSGQYVEFSSDGTFVDHQVLDQMLVPNAFFSSPRTQRGTYSIQHQTIIFTFSDGRRGMRTFYAPKAQEGGPMFDYIGLGWHVMYEQHHVSEP